MAGGCQPVSLSDFCVVLALCSGLASSVGLCHARYNDILVVESTWWYARDAEVPSSHDEARNGLELVSEGGKTSVEPCAARVLAETHLLRTACSSTSARVLLHIKCSRVSLCRLSVSPLHSRIVSTAIGQFQNRRLLRDVQQRLMACNKLHDIDGRSVYSYIRNGALPCWER